MADDKWKMAYDRWKMADDKWKMTDDRGKMADNRWSISDEHRKQMIDLQSTKCYEWLNDTPWSIFNDTQLWFI